MGQRQIAEQAADHFVRVTIHDTNLPQELETPPCLACRGQTKEIGKKRGRFIHRDFILRQCCSCQFVFVENPWTDYQQVYDENYYRGRGADPLVNYMFELQQPDQSIRQFELQGIVEAVRRHTPVDASTRRLDFGCGNGSLVRHCRKTTGCEAYGFEEGWIADRATEPGIPLLLREHLAGQPGRFDIITAIEVIEHSISPLKFLTKVRRLLKPGGLLFPTTRNSVPFLRQVRDWSYVIPEIHTSYFNPMALQRAFKRTGFRAEVSGLVPGWDLIFAFKILKNLGFRPIAPWMKFMPWRLFARVCDSKFRLTDIPIGRAV